MIIALGLFACGGGYPPELPLPAEYTTCEQDADCVVVELGCCDACNGGLAVSVHRDHASEVEDLYSESCGGGVDCTLMACAPWVTTCPDGSCELERGSFDE